MNEYDVDYWTTIYRRKKWEWARKVVFMEAPEWPAQILNWAPQLDLRTPARRRPGRPKTRWVDDIKQHVLTTLGHDDWTQVAMSEVWDQLRDDYIKN